MAEARPSMVVATTGPTKAAPTRAELMKPMAAPPARCAMHQGRDASDLAGAFIRRVTAARKIARRDTPDGRWESVVSAIVPACHSPHG